jgi:hypothetical protein
MVDPSYQLGFFRGLELLAISSAIASYHTLGLFEKETRAIRRVS